MGKARVVSRGLMSTSAANSASASFPPPLSDSPTNEEMPLLFVKPNFLRQQLPLATGSLYSSTDFPALVEPLPSLEVNEWIAAHTIGLFENVSTLYDAMYELCTCHTYTPELQELGSEGDLTPPIASRQPYQRGKRTAHQVINLALSECNDLIQSSRIFPIKQGQPFPADVTKEAARICRKLMLCLAHIYTAHLHHLELLELVAHANTLSKHFFAFTTHFGLMRDVEFGVLNGFHRLLLATPAPTPQRTSHATPQAPAPAPSSPSITPPQSLDMEPTILPIAEASVAAG